MFMDLSSEYWNNRYLDGTHLWDLGNISKPIQSYVDQLTNLDLKILIPGCGNGYEAVYLHHKGFKNVWVADVALAPLENILQVAPTFPKEHLIHGDFFNIDDTFDLILEQTFFCALQPSLRVSYVEKMTQLLKPNGRLVGLLFDAPLNNHQPPFGGSKEVYCSLFQPFFKFDIFEQCYNSHETRQGRELFIKFIKS